MGPESLTRQQYSPKSDVWSFGIVIIEMLTRDEPYPEMTPLNVAFAVGNHGASHPIPEGLFLNSFFLSFFLYSI